jgi:hypothetical protein
LSNYFQIALMQQEPCSGCFMFSLRVLRFFRNKTRDQDGRLHTGFFIKFSYLWARWTSNFQDAAKLGEACRVYLWLSESDMYMSQKTNWRSTVNMTLEQGTGGDFKPVRDWILVAWHETKWYGCKSLPVQNFEVGAGQSGEFQSNMGLDSTGMPQISHSSTDKPIEWYCRIGATIHTLDWP